MPHNPNEFAQATMPVTHPAAVTAGELAAVGDAVELAIDGQSAAAIALAGTWQGTVVFEGDAGLGWEPINAVAAATSGPQPTTTVNGIYRLTPAALHRFRVRLAARTSGTVAVVLRASLGTGGVFANQVLPVTLGTPGHVARGAPGRLVTSATTADQVVTSWAVPAGKTGFLQHASISARLNAVSETRAAFGPASLRIAGAVIATVELLGVGLDRPPAFAFAEPLPIPGGASAEWVVTPLATTGMAWRANLIGYER